MTAFTPRAEAALLRATMELLPHRQAESVKPKLWRAVAQRVAKETETEMESETTVSGDACMRRFRELLSIATKERRGQWPGCHDMHKLLETAMEEDDLHRLSRRTSTITTTRVALVDALGAPLAVPLASTAGSLAKEPQGSQKTMTTSPERPSRTAKSPSSASRSSHPKKLEDDEANANVSPAKKRKHHHESDERGGKKAHRSPRKTPPPAPKPLVLRLQRTSTKDPAKEQGEAPQWRFVEPEGTTLARHHASESRRSPKDKASKAKLDVPGSLVETRPAPKMTISVETASAQKVKRSRETGPPPPTAASSKARPAPKTTVPSKIRKAPEFKVKSKPRQAPVSVTPDALAASTAVCFAADASPTQQTPLRSKPPHEVEIDAVQREAVAATSCREISELKEMVHTMAAALATSQKEQIVLRQQITTTQSSSPSPSPGPGLGHSQLLHQQVLQLTARLNQAQLERNMLHRGVTSLHTEVTQLKSCNEMLQREVTALKGELTLVKQTQDLHADAFEDVAKERCAIEAGIRDADHRHEDAFLKFVQAETLKREELEATIEERHAKQHTNDQLREEAMTWFQEEMKRELNELRDGVERDVAVYDDLLDSVQDEHKKQLEALNAKISALAKHSKHCEASHPAETSGELQLQELREALDTERRERGREYKALLRSIQRIISTE